jgi:hypothetical protein
MYERMRQQWNVFRSQSLKSYEYVIGNQIDDDIREQLRKENRPAMIFNLLQPKIVTIAGLLEANKMYMEAIPVGEGDEAAAQMHTQLVGDWAMGNCNGIKEITKASLDAAIGKIGWTNNYWSTKEDPRGKWYTESYDPFMILFDADARRQDQKDWRYMCVTGFYTAGSGLADQWREIPERGHSSVMDRPRLVWGSGLLHPGDDHKEDDELRGRCHQRLRGLAHGALPRDRVP